MVLIQVSDMQDDTDTVTSDNDRQNSALILYTKFLLIIPRTAKDNL